MVNTRNSDAASQQPHLRATRRTPTQYSEAGKDAGSKGSAKQTTTKVTRHSSRLAGAPRSQVVELSDESVSDSENEVPNSKRTPRDRAKRQRMTYDEDDSPDLDGDDAQQGASDQADRRQTRSGRLHAHELPTHKGPSRRHAQRDKGKSVGFQSRYPKRNRSTVLRPEDSHGKGAEEEEESGSDQARQSDEEEESGEDQAEEEEEEEEEAEQGRKKYQLRERRPIQQANLYQPSFGGQGTRRSRLIRGSQLNRKNRHVRKTHRTTYAEDWTDTDDVLDHPAVAWKALQGPSDGLPWEGQGAGAGPSTAAASGGSALQPWGDAGGSATAGAGGRERGGNAEITPLEVDPSVSFDQVGGLEHYIKALKEMVFLPLVYPELFERFHLSPPRGVLFYGPPGTGKTLVARALAATASKAGTKVSFFMRKGADVLSKWVGEAERQLRLLFEEAQKAQPAIIFFDEIDGLAPVRSSKQDQIHNSIVSTLLALMDGLDSRGQVVVIGATNRLDALDGALRRPGRFDRELVFPLPNSQARASILDIHTRKWTQPPAAQLKQDLAHRCVGYCGADLKALCTEASLHALRRQYPQIYDTNDKLLVDPASVRVSCTDFLSAFKAITPSSHRSAVAHARPLPGVIGTCLGKPLASILGHLRAVFPPAAACLAAQGSSSSPADPLNQTGPAMAGNLMLDDYAEEEEDEGLDAIGAPLLGPTLHQQVQRPRLLICGEEGAGQSHLGPALLYALEGLPVHALGLPSLLSDASARSPEEAVVHAVLEARRASPAILFLPHLQLWWETAPASLRATLSMLLSDLPPDLPLLLLATADVPLADLDSDALKLFGRGGTGTYELSAPEAAERKAFFDGITQQLAQPPRANLNKKRKATAPPQLPRAPEAIAAEQEAQQAKRDQQLREEYSRDIRAVTELRRYLRKVVATMIAKSKYTDFLYPMDPEEDPEAYSKVQQHMDLGTLLHHVDHHMYPTCAPFLADVAIIAQAWRQYHQGSGDRSHPDADPFLMPSKAQNMVDEIRQAIASLPPHMDAMCRAIAAKGGPKVPPGMDDEEAQLLGGPPRPLPAPTAAGWKRPTAEMGRERHSKRLRGETVDKHIMFDNPELVARRIRQATLGESAARAPPKQGRAVHFEQPLPYGTGHEAMVEDEEAVLASVRQEDGGEEEEGMPAETPHTAVTHPAMLPDSAGSGLNLTLSNSAALNGKAGLLDEEEEAGNQAEVDPVFPASSFISDPPSTTGKLLAKSKNSLEEAQTIAQGILGSDLGANSVGANSAPASHDRIVAKHATANLATVEAKKVSASVSKRPHKIAEAVQEHAPMSVAPKTYPVSSVLASTTRPNVPRQIGGNPAQLKPAPASALRLAHAGHTPHPAKSRLVSTDPQPDASPQQSAGVVGGLQGPGKGLEGATPAATLRPFEGTTPYSSTVGESALPASHGMPVEDTPMPGVGPAMQHQLTPDSVMGQAVIGRVQGSMQSVAKRSPHSHPIHVTPRLSTIEEGDVSMAEGDLDAGFDRSAAASRATDNEVESQDAGGILETSLPLAEEVQQAEAFQAQLVQDTNGMVLDRLEEVHCTVSRIVWQHRRDVNRNQVIQEAVAAIRTVLQPASGQIGTV